MAIESGSNADLSTSSHSVLQVYNLSLRHYPKEKLRKGWLCWPIRRTENLAVWVSLLVVFFIQTLLLLAATFPVGKTSPGPIVQIQYGFVQGLILSIANPVRSKSSWASLYETPPIGINLFSWTRNPQKLATTHMADRQKLLFLNDDSDSLIWTGLVFLVD